MTQRPPRRFDATWLTFGLPIGLVLGIGIGMTVLDSLIIGFALGVLLGLGIGAVMGLRASDGSREDELIEDALLAEQRRTEQDRPGASSAAPDAEADHLP